MIPQRAEEIEKVYNKKRLVRNFDFEGIWHEPISRYLTPFDLKQLYYIATSPKFNAKPKTKFLEMDKIMLMRGFTRFASGTNRIVYKSEYDASVPNKSFGYRMPSNRARFAETSAGTIM